MRNIDLIPRPIKQAVPVMNKPAKIDCLKNSIMFSSVYTSICGYLKKSKNDLIAREPKSKPIPMMIATPIVVRLSK